MNSRLGLQQKKKKKKNKKKKLSPPLVHRLRDSQSSLTRFTIIAYAIHNQAKDLPYDCSFPCVFGVCIQQFRFRYPHKQDCSERLGHQRECSFPWKTYCGKPFLLWRNLVAGKTRLQLSSAPCRPYYLYSPTIRHHRLFPTFLWGKPESNRMWWRLSRFRRPNASRIQHLERGRSIRWSS